jgi:hypothetical protein
MEVTPHFQPNSEQVLGELDRIVTSSAFCKVERPARFLRHLVETALRKEPHLLKESVLGVEVFGRSASWDPRIDSIVRQEAARLRKRLARYYDSEGASSDTRIELPVGGYVPAFKKATCATGPLGLEPVASAASPRRRWGLMGLGAGIVALTAAGLVWFLPNSLVSTHRPAKPEAQELYLQGVRQWQKRTPASLNQAVDSFTQSIVRDPGYALAYVGLANCYNLLREYAAMPEKEAFPRALAATEEALALDESSAEAHASLAFISYWWNWNAALADREYRRAIALDPNYSNARHWYATFLLTRGRPKEALEQINVAQKLEATSVSILADKGLILYLNGERDAAVTLLKQVEEEDSALQSSPRYLAIIYLAEKDYPNYVNELKHPALANDQVARTIADAAEKGFAEGAQGMFQSLLDAEISLHRQGRLPAYSVAEIFASAGKTADAIHYLAISSKEPGSFFLYHRVDPAFRGMYSDPAFQKLDAEFEPLIATGTVPARK